MIPVSRDNLEPQVPSAFLKMKGHPPFSPSLFQDLLFLDAGLSQLIVTVFMSHTLILAKTLLLF